MKKKRQESKETAYYERKGKRGVTDELVLFSYNVRGLNQEGKQDELGLGLAKSAQHKLLLYSGYSPEWY